jgi:hypothetical protein
MKTKVVQRTATTNRMTPEEFEQCRSALPLDKGAAGVRFEQELARLFHVSGWTQEELAKVEGKSRPWIDQTLRFGRFLEIATDSINARSLNLHQFRNLWKDRSDKGSPENVRFKQVLAAVEAASIRSQQRPKLAGDLKRLFADGNWHRLDDMARTLETDEQHVRGVINAQLNTKRMRADKKRVGTDATHPTGSDAYRLFLTNRTVNYDELTTKLAPIIEGLEAEGKKNMATMSPATVAIFTNRLKKLIDDLGQ